MPAHAAEIGRHGGLMAANASRSGEPFFNLVDGAASRYKVRANVHSYPAAATGIRRQRETDRACLPN
jgi:hypothetical protein